MPGKPTAIKSSPHVSSNTESGYCVTLSADRRIAGEKPRKKPP
jgi:hypothetical protein